MSAKISSENRLTRLDLHIRLTQFPPTLNSGKKVPDTLRVCILSAKGVGVNFTVRAF